MSEIAGTVLALMAQRVITLMHRDLLQTSHTSHDAYIALMRQAGDEFQRRTGELFHNSLLTDSDFARRFTSDLPREFESLLWPEIRRQLVTYRECSLANLGLFRLLVTTEKLEGIEFSPDPVLLGGPELRLPPILEANEREVVERVHIKIGRTLSSRMESILTLPQPSALGITERIVVHTLDTVLKDINQALNSRALKVWWVHTYLVAEARVVAYVAYYAYVKAFGAMLSHEASTIVPTFGTFRRDGDSVIFDFDKDLFDLVSANLPRSKPGAKTGAA